MDAMRAMMPFCLAFALSGTVVLAQARATKTLDLYVIDVEGGNAQLYVSPTGESVLIDSGNGGPPAARHPARVMAGVQSPSTTPFHGDHVGGLPELATHGPIQEFIDHGANVQPGAQIDAVLQQYAQLY